MKTISRFVCAIFLVACAMPAVAHDHEHHHEAQAAPVPLSESLFNITDTWVTSDGKPFHLSELGGSPSVIAMIYTSCKDVCPLIVEDMKKIERNLPASLSGKVHFAVFSFDPDRDTTKKLEDFAEAHQVNKPTWVVANGKPESVRRLSVSLGLKYKKTRTGDYEHGVGIYVLDKDGVIQFVQSKLLQDGEDAVTALRKLEH